MSIIVFIPLFFLVLADFVLWGKFSHFLILNHPVAYKKIGSPGFFVQRLPFDLDIKIIRNDVGDDYKKIRNMKILIFFVEFLLMINVLLLMYMAALVW